jgi:hypothetical protein
MLKTKKFPERLYIYRENEGTNDEFLCFSEKEEDIDIINDKIRVGIYELKMMAIVKNKTEIERFEKA